MDEHSLAVIQSMQRILNVDKLTYFGVNIITPGPNGDFKCIELLEHLIEMKKYVCLKLFKFAARILSDANEDRYGRSYFTTSRMDLLHVSVSIVSILKWKDWTLLHDSEELAAFYFAYAEKAIRCMEYNKHSNIENYTFVTTSLSHYFRCGYPIGLTVSEFNSELPYMLGQTIAMPMEQRHPDEPCKFLQVASFEKINGKVQPEDRIFMMITKIITINGFDKKQLSSIKSSDNWNHEEYLKYLDYIGFV